MNTINEIIYLLYCIFLVVAVVKMPDADIEYQIPVIIIIFIVSRIVFEILKACGLFNQPPEE